MQQEMHLNLPIKYQKNSKSITLSASFPRWR